MNRTWYREADTWLPVVVLLLALGTYSATLAPTIDFWDCAEYVTTSHIVGVPHQPGTPLYVLVGRVFDLVLGQPDIETASQRTAWAVNFMSALFSALAVMMVYLIIVRVARRSDPDSGWLARLGGLVGAIFLLFSDTFWNNAIEAEVYGLAAFMMTTLTWFGLVWFDHRTERRSDWLLLLLIYLCGLGVGFHLGSLLVYPAFFLMVWLATDRQLPIIDLTLVSAGLAFFLASTTFITDPAVLRTLFVLYCLGCVVRLGWPLLDSQAGRGDPAAPRLRPFALIGLVLFLTGLSVHTALMIRAGAQPEPAINQTVPKDFDTLLSVLRREQYPPLNPLERRAPLEFQFGYYWEFFLRQFSFLPQPSGTLDRISVAVGPLLLALLGLAHTVRRARPLAWLLVACYFINADGLTLYLNFSAEEVRERDYFYFAAFLYCSVFIGLGTGALLRWTSGPLGPTLARLERQAAPPPAGRPFSVAGFGYRVAFAFVVALLLMVVVPGRPAGIAADGGNPGTKLRWLGLFLFGAVFVGLGAARWLTGSGTPRRGRSTGQAWSERSELWRWLAGFGLAGAVLAGGLVLYGFAVPSDRVFVLGVYGALLAGLMLEYGERRGGPRPAARPALPAPIRPDALSWVAGLALVVLAALPGIGRLDPQAHRKWYTHDRSENRIAYEYAYNILAGLDEGAILFTNGDNDTFPIWYLQEVEHFRRDVTVVNLSLVNLDWYVKQLKRLAEPVAISRTDKEIEQLKQVAYRDPKTGEVVVVWVRDYVVQDIIDTNRAAARPRPIFFAVTIPRENMARYYPFLQMEGLAYRLTENRTEDGLPETDPDRLLANVFGAYEFDALTTGDTDERHATFAAQAGWSTDRAVQEYLTALREPAPVDYEGLLALVGESRTDVFRNPNTVNLLGNYPASIARAGFSYLTLAEELRQPDGGVAPEDTSRYDDLTGRAMVAYELALRFDPTNGLVAAGYYPSLLLERGKIDSALSYLETIHGRTSADLENSAVLTTMRGLVAMNRSPVAVAWLEARITAEPAWRLGYELLFRIHEAAGAVGKAAAVVDRWREANGQDDPALRRQLEELRATSFRQEQERLEEAVRESRALPETPR
ncbi:MAG TPA: DUF2723 domain-containing protein [Candidatus Krumholzibacteria bacterium]|nr:DUF2723 domain-containing protein [Candidatus Krumholzibacteria bacterium]HPD72764.1 DUF2723 domain-containing protein [Candidatus Krumholzibacteria bacterium]HRY40304.1 DUF2723 domain-containing protein [Candidatus Krumholzibacteria bacterium]